MVAAENGHTAVVRYLLEQGAIDESDVEDEVSNYLCPRYKRIVLTDHALPSV